MIDSLNDWLTKHFIVFVILFFTLAFILICSYLIYGQKNYYYETAPIIYEITDKEVNKTVSYHIVNKVMVPKYHTNYYFICEDLKIKVSYGVYSDYDINDKIVLTEKTKYLKEDNSIVDISYEFNN